MKAININKFLFGRTKAEKKLQVINEMSASDIRKTTSDTILRIVRECKDEQGKFYINSDRRKGNDWSSVIRYLYIYKGRPEIMLTYLGDSTDWDVPVSYADFTKGDEYRGSCRYGSFVYRREKVTAVVRCILAEYVYYRWIEKDAREAEKKLSALTSWKVVNPVENYYYEKWNVKWHQPSGPGPKDAVWERYLKGEDALDAYISSHVDELTGKSADELDAIYKKAFVGEIK